MKSVSTRITEDGGIEIPTEMLEELGLREGDLLHWSIEDGRVIIEPAAAAPTSAKKYPARIRDAKR
jgi:AbrB family looped-hinge helix DNA binding protein